MQSADILRDGKCIMNQLAATNATNYAQYWQQQIVHEQ
jgi:hypothetical protein